MSARAVHWCEGMFLRPHHMQATLRNLAQAQHTSETWDTHYNWGLRDIVIDPDALANHRLVIRRLRIRLHDGSAISVPEDGELPVLDLKTLFENENQVTVYLGVPTLHLGRPNVSGINPEEAGRYLVDTLDLEDENTGLNPQPIEVRRLNLHLLRSNQDQTGFEVLPIVRLEKSPGADPTPQIHKKYIPPVLACDGWNHLQQEILQAIYDNLGSKIERLAEQMTSRGISLESVGSGDSLITGQLRAMNEGYAVLHILAFAKGVHPLKAYTELCRLVGQLSIFGALRRTPVNLPRYDHDDLGGCFYQIKAQLEDLLDNIKEPEYKSRPFEGTGSRMQVAVEPSWLESQWSMFVGIKSPLPTEKCERMWTRPYFDMKIGSSQTVDRIFGGGLAGLRFTYTPHPPRALPSEVGLLYFEVSRQSEEWQNVTQALSLAIRLREKAIVGNIEGQQVINIRTPDGEVSTMQFTLYVVKKQS